MKIRPIVGVMGQKQSGKDTFGRLLVERHRFERFAFADALKVAALRVDPLLWTDFEVYPALEYRLSDAVEEKGWDEAKTYQEVHRFLQEFGVAIRSLDEDFWLRQVMGRAGALASMGYPVVVTDVRFQNEAQAIRDAGGVLVRVDRPGLPDEDRHVSENAWRSVTPDYSVVNDGPVGDLAAPADFIAARLGLL